MTDSFKELYKYRKPPYCKNPEDEAFLEWLNESLQHEQGNYLDLKEEHPFIFIFGLPRSGTTLLTQLVANCFDIGYINNFTARFWKAPITGIKLSGILFDREKKSDFKSDYGRTGGIADIHDFAYFWQRWLKIRHFSDLVDIKAKEKEIDWKSLKKALLNIQGKFGKGLAAKAIYLSCFMKRCQELLQRALFVYVERNELDVAVSILDARRKFQTNVKIWWGAWPPEYPKIKDLPYMEQIAGQVYYLKKFYDEQIRSINANNLVCLRLEDLCIDPLFELKKIELACNKICDNKPGLIQDPPLQFKLNLYNDRKREKEEFKRLLEKFKNNDRR